MKSLKVTLVWGLIKDGTYWKCYFGIKHGSLMYSPQFLTEERAYSRVQAEIDQARIQYGEDYQVIDERKDFNWSTI